MVLNAAAFVVNLCAWNIGSGKHLPLALHMHGGEITVELGFGLRAVHTYAMRVDQVTTHHLAFDPISMVVCLLVCIGIVYLVLFIGGRLFKK